MDNSIAYHTFDLDALPKLVSFWNSIFRDRRNFYPVDKELFMQRIINQEPFDLKGFMMAMAGEKVIGMVHAMKPAPSSYFVYRENRCWKNGVIAVIAVDPNYRNSGIGSELLRRAEDYLTKHLNRGSYIYIGDYWVPLYHTLEGPRQPFWGDTEMMGIGEEDQDFIEFLKKRGYKPILDEGQETTMVSRLGNRDLPNRPDLRSLKLREVEVSERKVWNGKIGWYPESEGMGYIYARFGPYVHTVIALAREDTIVSHLEWFPMRREKTVALLDFLVADEDRGYGLGSYLLDKALWTMAQQGYDTVELHTNTRRNAKAFDMYMRRGYRVVKKWVGLRKKLII